MTAGSAALSARLPHAFAQKETSGEDRANADSGGGLYFPNRAPLAAAPFLRLPPGSIRPGGWLRHQLELQLEGLNGRMSEISDYLVYQQCGWVEPGKIGWEELPYWLRGFGDLGYVTGDERVLALTRKWIDGILATQQASGWFGPTSLQTSLDGGPDCWPVMPVLDALRSFEEYTGDPRIIPFLLRYSKYQNTLPVAVFGRGWGNFRYADNMDTVFWLYNRTGEPWLLDLARKMHQESADYTGGIPTWHNVNLAQGFREPAQFGLLARDSKFSAATYRDYDAIMRVYGQFPGGGFAGDENSRPGYTDPRQGLETCGIVEFMRSFEILTRITGDPIWADRCEELAFNSLPAAFDPEQKGTHYVTCANNVELKNTAKHHHQYDNDFAMDAYMPGVHQYRCCPHNYGMGWPYYAEESWLATADNGLCASLYAPSEARAKVGSGAEVKVVETTDYPFGDTVQFHFESSRPIQFPMYFRIPRWCSAPELRINGRTVAIEKRSPCYVIADRVWKRGDEVKLRLPMEVAVHRWQRNHNALSISRGALTYSLAISEQWTRFAGTERWPEYEVLPQSPWNYGLIVDSSAPERSLAVVTKAGSVIDPFRQETAPIEIQAKARKIPGWQQDEEGVIGLLQESPVRSSQPEETVRLIPMGAARLRITAFPEIGEGPDAQDWKG